MTHAREIEEPQARPIRHCGRAAHDSDWIGA